MSNKKPPKEKKYVGVIRLTFYVDDIGSDARSLIPIQNEMVSAITMRHIPNLSDEYDSFLSVKVARKNSIVPEVKQFTIRVPTEG